MAKFEKFRNYRRNVKKAIKRAKSNFYANKFNEHKGDMKKTWEIINQLRGKTKAPMKPIFEIDNKRITDRRIIACEFNKYFVSIAKMMNDLASGGNDIHEANVSNFTNYLGRSYESSIYLSDCTADEIHTIISELDNGKASDIPIKLIKRSSHVIGPILE